MKKIYLFAFTLFLSVFMINAIAQPTIVNTQNLTLDVVNKQNYDIDSVQYDLDQTLTDLGITSISEAVPVVYTGDGSFTTASNENSGGFFVGAADTLANWGAGGVVYITHFIVIDGWVAVGQFPDSLTAYIDQSLTFSYGLMANDKVELLKITLNITENPGITGDIVNTQNLSLDVVVKPNYDIDSVQFDLDQTLTDLGIASLNEATVIAYDEEGKFTDGSNEGSGGFWFGSAGIPANWGAGAVVYVTNFLTVDGYMAVGQFPDSLGMYAFVNEPVTVKYGFLANEKIEMLEITVNAVPYTQEISVNVDSKPNYDVDIFQYDLPKTLADLGLDSITDASVVAVSVLADGSHDTISNENSGGFWLGHSGLKTDWGAGGVVYVTHFDFTDGEAGIGQFPDSLNIYQGSSFTVMYGMMANSKMEMLEITVNVNDNNTNVNLQDANKQGLTIFNNPVLDELKVTIPGNGSSVNGTLTIYSITGAKVLSKQVTSETETLDLGHFSSGVYFLNYDNGSTREAIKFIKQ